MEFESALLELGVSPNDIQKARTYQSKYGGMLEKLLVNMGSMSEDVLPDLYAKVLNAPLFDSKAYIEWQLPANASTLFNIPFMLRQGWVPLTLDEDKQKAVFLTKQPISHAMTQMQKV